MAKGQIAKEQLMNEILNLLGDRAFKYDKDIRVNCTENGELVQIKLAFTAAKVAVECGEDNALPAATAVSSSIEVPAVETTQIPEPTTAEKHNIAELMKKLGL